MAHGLLFVTTMLIPVVTVGAVFVALLFQIGTSGVRRLLMVQATVFLALAVGLTAFVAAEDDYTDDGGSRWEVYDNQAVTAAAIAGCVVVGLLAAFAAQRRPGLSYLTVPLGLFVPAVAFVALAGMTN